MQTVPEYLSNPSKSSINEVQSKCARFLMANLGAQSLAVVSGTSRISVKKVSSSLVASLESSANISLHDSTLLVMNPS